MDKLKIWLYNFIKKKKKIIDSKWPFNNLFLNRNLDLVT